MPKDITECLRALHTSLRTIQDEKVPIEERIEEVGSALHDVAIALEAIGEKMSDFGR